MEEAIAVDTYGLCPPIDLWQFRQNGATNLAEEEISDLAEAARTLREAEIQLLLGAEAGVWSKIRNPEIGSLGPQ